MHAFDNGKSLVLTEKIYHGQGVRLNFNKKNPCM